MKRLLSLVLSLLTGITQMLPFSSTYANPPKTGAQDRTAATHETAENTPSVVITIPEQGKSVSISSTEPPAQKSSELETPVSSSTPSTPASDTRRPPIITRPFCVRIACLPRPSPSPIPGPLMVIDVNTELQRNLPEDKFNERFMRELELFYRKTFTYQSSISPNSFVKPLFEFPKTIVATPEASKIIESYPYFASRKWYRLFISPNNLNYYPFASKLIQFSIRNTTDLGPRYCIWCCKDSFGTSHSTDEITRFSSSFLYNIEATAQYYDIESIAHDRISPFADIKIGKALEVLKHILSRTSKRDHIVRLSQTERNTLLDACIYMADSIQTDNEGQNHYVALGLFMILQTCMPYLKEETHPLISDRQKESAISVLGEEIYNGVVHGTVHIEQPNQGAVISRVGKACWDKISKATLWLNEKQRMDMEKAVGPDCWDRIAEDMSEKTPVERLISTLNYFNWISSTVILQAYSLRN